MTALAPSARVLLIRLSALVDVVFALETLASLKAERPDLRCDFLIEDRFASLLLGHPQIERVLVFPRRRKAATIGDGKLDPRVACSRRIDEIAVDHQG